MKIPSWPQTISQARALQHILKNKVRVKPLTKQPRFVAGLDAAFTGDRVIGAACLFRYPDLTLIEETYAERKAEFPYVPGFLSFREGPVLIAVMDILPIKPDLILVDGQGIAHPLGLGLASHMGLLLNLPSIGCAKSRLVGEYEEPGLQRGSWSPLFYHNRMVGAVMRTRENVKPLFISPGHRIDLKDSIGVVMTCVSRYRIPEPLRRADFLSKKMKRASDDYVAPHP